TTGTTTSRLSTTSSAGSATRRGAIPSFSKLTTRSTSANGTGASKGSAASSIGFKKPSLPASASGSVRSSLVTGTGTGSVRSSVAGRGSVNGPPSVRQRTSTLLAPTASSLAKLHSNIKPPSISTARPGVNATPVNQEIKETPAPTPAEPRRALPAPPSVVTSPLIIRKISSPVKTPGKIFGNGTPGKIFSSGTPSFIPTRKPETPAASMAMEGQSAPALAPAPKAPVPAKEPVKTRLRMEYRPRISRSRVIARVGAQRTALAAAGPSSTQESSTARRSLNAPRARGSLAKGARASAGLAKTRQSLAAAHARKMRRSEILRRKSRAGSFGGGLGAKGDDDDDNEGYGHEDDTQEDVSMSMGEDSTMQEDMSFDVTMETDDE
ncbi:hypothetical protein M422DRAFT_270817, partial [Sphaerobolus stellatus SS14]